MDRKSPLRISQTVLGCKVNQSDAAALRAELLTRGHQVVSFQQPADVCILHTCTVTRKTDYQSRQLIRRAIARNPQARIIVTGCYAETAPEAIQAIPGVDFIAGTGEQERIVEVVGTGAETEKPLFISSPAEQRDGFQRGIVPFFFERTRAYLKVQDGCDAFCSYCIVPQARGRNRSLPLDKALSLLRQLAEQGFKEIVLAGIHLGSYGKDLVPPRSLWHFLRAIDEGEQDIRVRLSSIEPGEFHPFLVDFLGHSQKICPHLHVPLQSGDDEILRRMNRHYSGAFFEELINGLVGRIPGLAVGVDVIGGFPGEDERAFANTLNLIERLPIAYLHIFPFSRRRGTAAEGFSGQIPPQTIKSRCRTLRELGEKKRGTFYRSFLGKKMRVLVESKRDQESGWLRGYSRNYIPILVQGGEERINQEVEVVVANVRGIKVFGKIV